MAEILLGIYGKFGRTFSQSEGAVKKYSCETIPHAMSRYRGVRSGSTPDHMRSQSFATIGEASLRADAKIAIYRLVKLTSLMYFVRLPAWVSR